MNKLQFSLSLTCSTLVGVWFVKASFSPGAEQIASTFLALPLMSLLTFELTTKVQTYFEQRWKLIRIRRDRTRSPSSPPTPNAQQVYRFQLEEANYSEFNGTAGLLIAAAQELWLYGSDNQKINVSRAAGYADLEALAKWFSVSSPLDLNNKCFYGYGSPGEALNRLITQAHDYKRAAALAGATSYKKYSIASCQGCRKFVGQFDDGTLKICSQYPQGWQSESCPAFEWQYGSLDNSQSHLSN